MIDTFFKSGKSGKKWSNVLDFILENEGTFTIFPVPFMTGKICQPFSRFSRMREKPFFRKNGKTSWKKFNYSGKLGTTETENVLLRKKLLFLRNVPIFPETGVWENLEIDVLVLGN